MEQRYRRALRNTRLYELSHTGQLTCEKTGLSISLGDLKARTNVTFRETRKVGGDPSQRGIAEMKSTAAIKRR